jgi:pimeloyl-ACP methyl ester carboxylesterase
MATYVLVHGSFWGSWVWTDLVRLLRAAGHDAYAPSLTGLGERVHLASPEITLDTHIQDVCNTLIYEELQDVVLAGWSGGGLVITGVAERLPERITHLVFVDAALPMDGESLCSMMGSDFTEWLLDQARATGDGWRFGRAPDRAFLSGLSVRERSWCERSVPQPLQTMLQPLAIRNSAAVAIARTYIRCTDRQWPSDIFWDAAIVMLERCAAVARESGWAYHDLHTQHHAMLTEPQALADILLDHQFEGTLGQRVSPDVVSPHF